MLYLLDADTLIRADREAYPLGRFPPLWNWLLYQGDMGCVKITLEQYEEIIAGNGELVDWLNDEDHRQSLLLPDEVDLAAVQQVLSGGYAPDLNEDEVEKIGRDPFLVARDGGGWRAHCSDVRGVRLKQAARKSQAPRCVQAIWRALYDDLRPDQGARFQHGLATALNAVGRSAFAGRHRPACTQQ